MKTNPKAFAVQGETTLKKEMTWSPALIKLLRGKRTQAELGAILGVPRNTIRRWEAGHASPDPENSKRLAKLAERDHFLEGWNPVGSMIPKGDLEEASRQIRTLFQKSLSRSARKLG